MRIFWILIIFFLESVPKLPAQIYSQLTFHNNAQAIEEDAFLFDSSDTVRTNENEATVAVSEDNQVVLSYRDNKGSGNLYISVLNENIWTAPEKVNKIVNTEGWEPDEYISTDGNWLYFTSKRVGGFGGKDLYRSEKLLNGEWSEGVNLGPTINTKYDEEAPVLLPDATTLYFSSNGHKSNGGFNVFKSTIIAGEVWTEPANVGYPINKTDENFLYAADDKKTFSDFSKETTYCEKDNCILTFKNNKEVSFILIKGNIDRVNGKILEDIKITVTDNETEKVISLYNVNGKTGHKFSFILPFGRNNNITFYADGYLFQSENINLLWKNTYCMKTENIQLPSIAVGSKIILNNIFFDPGKTSFSSASNTELNNILDLMNNNPNLKVKIVDYMIYKKNSKENKIISQLRAQAVVNYLIDRCISKDRMDAKGYVKYKSKESTKKKIPANSNCNEWIELNVIKK
jgi:outer membrane protein OmpA-like peptidoglycan-associated protein